MNSSELKFLLTRLGCPQEKSEEMAAQLEKRATQVAVERNLSHEQALAHLVQLMSQGWAAKERGYQGA